LHPSRRTRRDGSFTERGISSTVGAQDQLSELTVTIDAYRALELLAKYPRIDPARIGLFGNSRGGVSALYASLKRFQRMVLTILLSRVHAREA